ncbi:hypothetical protein [Nonlabens antarcticus]|uniref:hypothetical protein n=1 Tax=Nonlabens antarcticus TaxID=392714 RepID=UPI001891E4D9|nr:hypothetical protein [Nonlabens antarcticus]
MNKVILALTVLILCSSLSLAQHGTEGSELISLESFMQISGLKKNEVPKEAIIFKDQDTLIRARFETKANDSLISVPYDYRSKEFTDLYKKVAFVDPNRNDTIPARMRYWKDEMRVYFAEEVDRKDKKGLTAFADEIFKQVDSLKIRIVRKLEDANFIVYYSNHYEFEPRMSKTAHIDYYLSWNGAFIDRGFLRVDKERYFNDDQRLQSLKRYFFRTLGYFNGTNSLDCGSYFSTCSNAEDSLSQLDLELLQYHYSYGICKGVTLQTYDEQLESAQTYKKEGIIFSVLHDKSIFSKD